ncbi:energy transducer TonB [bacterium]|nr:energy transducer TonB [bacterium]
MVKTKLTIAVLALILAGTILHAKPMNIASTSQPTPRGGIRTLELNATYPLWAKAEQIESNVILQFYVDREGNVSNVHITKSGGNIFDQSAIDAVLSTKWEPARQDGFPVAVTFELPFEYRSK